MRRWKFCHRSARGPGHFLIGFKSRGVRKFQEEPVAGYPPILSRGSSLFHYGQLPSTCRNDARRFPILSPAPFSPAPFSPTVSFFSRSTTAHILFLSLALSFSNGTDAYSRGTLDRQFRLIKRRSNKLLYFSNGTNSKRR